LVFLIISARFIFSAFEGGKAQRPKAVKLQLRPDPLAR
jgi:hypothetical protein